MIRFIYTIALSIAAPFLLYGLYKKKEGKPSFGKRWKEHFGITPPLKSNKRPIWIHAVSVGESIAAIPIIKSIKAQHPETPIVVTTTTSTGAEQIDKLGRLVEHRYMPLDFPFVLKRFIKTINPKSMLIMETELWPNTLTITSRNNIPIAVLNARLSSRSTKRYMKIKPIFDLVSKHISLILCQNDLDNDNFLQLGVEANKCITVGSVKFDLQLPDNIDKASKKIRCEIGKFRPVWIAASTHKGEDEILLAAHKQIMESNPRALLILVPRHPERFGSVEKLCSDSGLNVVKRSSNIMPGENCHIYLGDTMGELPVLIGAADVCFMAGSFSGEKVGGHNVLEAAAMSTPVLTGPSYYNFKEVVEEMQSRGLIKIVEPDNLADAIRLLLNETEESNAQLKNGLTAYVTEKAGAVDKTLIQLKDIL